MTAHASLVITDTAAGGSDDGEERIAFRVAMTAPSVVDALTGVNAHIGQQASLLREQGKQ